MKYDVISRTDKVKDRRCAIIVHNTLAPVANMDDAKKLAAKVRSRGYKNVQIRKTQYDRRDEDGQLIF